MGLPIQYDHVPQPAATVAINITLGQGMRTPQEVMIAVHHALMEYGRSHNGTTTPFTQQPGFPQGFITNSSGVPVGTWEVKGLTP